MKATTLCILALLLCALTAGAIPSRPVTIRVPQGCELYVPKRRGKRGRRGK